MNVTVATSGGFAGLTMMGELDTTTVAPAGRANGEGTLAQLEGAHSSVPPDRCEGRPQDFAPPHNMPIGNRPTIPPLRRGEAHVWWAERRHASARLGELLDGPENTRLRAYSRTDDRERFVVGCALAKVALSRYLGRSPVEIRFSRRCQRCGRPHGKPRLISASGPPLEFSVSHAGDFSVVAVTLEFPVGVDVEPLDRSLAIDELCDLVFAESELHALGDLGPIEVNRNFLVWWTRKEAIVKASGLGFELAPASVIVTRPDESPGLLAWPHHFAPEQVALFDLAEREGHIAALAILGDCASVREFDGSELLAPW